MKKILSLLIFSFFSTIIYAQVSDSKSLSDSTIQWKKGSFWVRGNYTIGDVPTTNKVVYNKLKNSTASANELKEYNKYKHLTAYSFGAAMSCLVASLIVDKGSSSWKSTSGKVLFGVGCGL
ncbi:hypothetical protein [Mucilaginibacter polytrichastri]|uniref:Uncharacterized protein n=1 Tax=Mucilaginibacter polytrichastri TaxID=1302689 RepID=A0A1Q6A1C3_9SPHI|nr:hypothetical protein [Mucilaginibacter polytrichastri]OKS87816.1 hypothetical protein RG47T_3279 [Mucilaginibacter polytrichastri]SFT25902.1 hypothetical protein SAMN04487890_1246 [Mucilaginibacter polytrichastri]